MNLKKIGILLVMCYLSQEIYTLNWQAHGNLSESNITIINTKIAELTSLINAQSNPMPYSTAASNLSEYLNSLWDPAWNVFISKIAQANDGVVYGYAFRSHWFWSNDFSVSNLCFIIWKDYNCNPSGWLLYNPTVAALNIMEETLQSLLNDEFITFTVLNPSIVFNPWLVAKHMVDYAQDIALPNSAWTALVYAFMIDYTTYGAKFCSLTQINSLSTSYVQINDVTYFIHAHLLRMR